MFAKLSIVEIQKLHSAKVSGFEMLVYSVISSHIHSSSRKNAWPSLKRIATVLGGNTTIQSISRAIKGLSDKKVIVKGKVRSKSRFTLIWRPVKKKVATAMIASKHFVSRFTPSSLSNAFKAAATKPSRQKQTYQMFEYKKPYEVEKSNIFEKRGQELWEQVAPTGFDGKVKTERLRPEEKIILKDWLLQGNTEQKNWIQSEYGEMI